jgi:hypothetical protein
MYMYINDKRLFLWKREIEYTKTIEHYIVTIKPAGDNITFAIIDNHTKEEYESTIKRCLYAYGKVKISKGNDGVKIILDSKSVFDVAKKQKVSVLRNDLRALTTNYNTQRQKLLTESYKEMELHIIELLRTYAAENPENELRIYLQDLKAKFQKILKTSCTTDELLALETHLIKYLTAQQLSVTGSEIVLYVSWK